VFMDGETEFAAALVERFTAYHRRSYVCKTGLGDVIIGAAALIADYNGAAHATPAGNYEPDDLLANVCKHNVTRFPYELARLAQDLAGGLVATLPSEKDFDNPETGPLLRKYLKGRDGVSVEDRARVLRLIENMTLGRNAVGYLTESMHGAGSPQAQRIQIARQMKLEEKKSLARALAGIPSKTDPE
jgi:4-hydroxybutyryl-CoA dehydratase/vinylacetyl-CoA-Delta-isomerase